MTILVLVEGVSPFELEYLHSMTKLPGPFAFVFLDKRHGQLYFGRDRLGRRSLVSKYDFDLGTFELCSISGEKGFWLEVEADGVYQLSYDSSAWQNESQHPPEDRVKTIAVTYKHPWATADSDNSVCSPFGASSIETFRLCHILTHSRDYP